MLELQQRFEQKMNNNKENNSLSLSDTSTLNGGKPKFVSIVRSDPFLLVQTGGESVHF